MSNDSNQSELLTFSKREMHSYNAERLAAWRLLIPVARDDKKWPDVRREESIITKPNAQRKNIIPRPYFARHGSRSQNFRRPFIRQGLGPPSPSLRIWHIPERDC